MGTTRKGKTMSYEDQMSAAKFKADRDALAQAVQGVCEDMEAHALGFEGMEDAPVTRWDRDLRAALGGMQEAVEHAMTMDPNAQRLLQEDEDAARWVRDHGGLESVSKRLMPEDYEWPRYESGEPVKLGDYVPHESEPVDFEVVEIAFSEAYGVALRYEDQRDGNSYNGLCLSDGERVKRPQVLASDGEPLEVGQTVYLPDGTPIHVTAIGDMKAGQETVFGKAGNDIDDGEWSASKLTNQRPVLDADGAPINVGDTVWYQGHIEPLEVRSVATEVSGFDYVTAYNDYEGKVSAPSDMFSHRRVEPDSYQSLYADMGGTNKSNGIDFGEFVRRCKELAVVSE